MFESLRLSNEGLRALHGLELTRSTNLPRAAAVVADATGACGEDGLLDLFSVRFGDIEDQ